MGIDKHFFLVLEYTPRKEVKIMENNMRIVEQKKLLDLAMDLYFVNGAKSGNTCEGAEKSIIDAYEHIFGEGSAKGLREQTMIINALNSYDDISRLIDSVKANGKIAEFSRDDLIINQKRLINIAKELSFVLGTRSNGKFVKSSEETLRRNFESIFGEGSSKGKTVSRLAGEVIAKLEAQNYAGFDMGDGTEPVAKA